MASTLARIVRGALMFDLDLFYNARWQDLYGFFASGHPPLVLKLLLINTVCIVFFIYRSATRKYPMRYSTVYMIQGLLIAANAFMMFQSQLMPYLGRFKNIL